MKKMEYEPIIGLEVHIQSKTKSKMFCGCSADYFGAEPNTHTCPICLGLPGAMPVPNKKAIELCVKLALALNCKINKETKFDRKNYFYPDLPKGYQISQYDQPIGYEGYVDISVNDIKKRIGITRVHQEEDTAKSVHEHGKTLIDFNKSGVPLIEVVSEPDFRTVEEVTEYAKELHLITRNNSVSNADMEKGQMRFEINISLRKEGLKDLPNYKVEVKNISSISVLQKVIKKEIERQRELFAKGETPVQETRGLKDMTGETFTQRTKETADDYRYFPEPDIPLIEFSESYIDSIKNNLQESPSEKIIKFQKDYGLKEYTAKVIVSNTDKLTTFEKEIRDITDKKVIIEVANIVTGIYSDLIKKGIAKNSKGYIKDISEMIVHEKINRSLVRDVLTEALMINRLPHDIYEGMEHKPVNTEVACQKVIHDNARAVKDIKTNPNAIMHLVGEVMKITNGRAKAQEVQKILREKLGI